METQGIMRSGAVHSSVLMTTGLGGKVPGTLERMAFRMRRSTKVLLLACGLALLVVGVARLRRVHCTVLANRVVADGRFHPIARLTRRLGSASTLAVSVTGADPSRIVLQATENGELVLYRAPVRGAKVDLHLSANGQRWSLPVKAALDWSDRVGDGLPDALRLHDAEDRLRFRRWLTALADRAAAVPDGALPPEITDCSALLRYSYRLALVKHDDRWYKQFAPGTMPLLPSVAQWSYPETPLGANLFRVTPAGPAPPRPSDFAEFADAKTLYTRNTFRVGRNIYVARPGDLLFFHQLEGEQQYHSMIVTGDEGAWVVYHTGPSGTGASRNPGQMRRARIADLLQHPDPRWHPTPQNPNFLGVFRWNVLRED